MGWDGMGMGWKSLALILRAPLCGANKASWNTAYINVAQWFRCNGIQHMDPGTRQGQWNTWGSTEVQIIRLQCSVMPCMGRIVLRWGQNVTWDRILLATLHNISWCSAYIVYICNASASAVEVKALCGLDCKAHVVLPYVAEYCLMHWQSTAVPVQVKALCGPDCSQGGSQPNQLLSPGELNWPYHMDHTIPDQTIPNYTRPNHTILYQTISYHTIPDHIIPYFTSQAKPNHNIPYHTMSNKLLSPGAGLKWSEAGAELIDTPLSPALNWNSWTRRLKTSLWNWFWAKSITWI